MMQKTFVAAAALVLTLPIAACQTSEGDAASPGSSSSIAVVSAPRSAGTAADSRGQQVAGTVMRFSAGSQSVDVTIDVDSPAARDFVSMLPFTTTLKEFNGREKVGDLPRALRYAGSSGSDPKDGDLIYFVPWGSLGFYYNADGIGYSDQTLHLGTYHASREQLAQLEGRVTVQVVR